MMAESFERPFHEQFFAVPFFALSKIKAWPGGPKLGHQRAFEWFTCSCFVVAISACVLASFENIVKGDFLMFADALAPASTMFSQLLKYAIFCSERGNFKRMLSSLEALEKESHPRARQANLEKARFLRKANSLYLASATSTSVFFCSTPWIVAVYRSYLGLPFVYILQFQSSWLFDFGTVPRYTVLYILLGYVIWFVPGTLGGIDNFILNYSAYIGSMFDSVRFEIQDIGQQVDRHPFFNKTVRRRLAVVIDKHVAAITFCKKWETLIGSLVFVEFASAALQICLSGFLILAANSLAFRITYVFFFTAIVLQAFYYCYGGNEVTESSVKIAEEVYQMPWEKLDMDNKKTLVLIMARSQVPVGIRVPFFDCAFPLFLNIMQAAGSYLTLLDTLMNK